MPALNSISPYPKVAVPTAKGLVFFQVSDILYFEADNTVSVLHYSDKGIFKEVVVFSNLTALEVWLAKYGFLRIRRNVLINPYNIKTIGKDKTVTMLDHTLVHPSRNKVVMFEHYIKEHFCF